MKKAKIIILAVVAILFFNSCSDDSGKYARQIYKNSEITDALQDCLIVSLDTALLHLAPSDSIWKHSTATHGFSSYGSEIYRIKLPSTADNLVDTLEKYGQNELIDSLNAKMNRMAEHSYVAIYDVFNDLIDDVTYSDSEEVLMGEGSATVADFKVRNQYSLNENLKSRIEKQMQTYLVSEQWNEVINTYTQYSSDPVNIDLASEITRQIVNCILLEMAIEEHNIRTITAHRTVSSLKTVFSLLDY